jgi:hypothetical protein
MRACCKAVHAEATRVPAKKADWELAGKTCDALAERIANGVSSLGSATAALRAAAVNAGPLPAGCK